MEKRKMTDELIVRARQNCCRLCLAPDSECVPIFTTSAADKEPLATKINACVGIKVSQADRLSARICHACISYLNSWQSFKNRCVAAQMKQQNWLEMAKKTVRQQFNQIRTGRTNLLSSGKQSIKQRYQAHVPFVIKQEPSENNGIKYGKRDEDDSVKVDLDPRQFLSGNVEVVEEDENSPAPNILTSLGLTSIHNNFNPFSFLSTELHETSQAVDTEDSTANESTNNIETSDTPAGMPSCRVCSMVFSTRANARRHERNIHGRVASRPVSQISTKPPPAPLTPEMMGIFDYDNPIKYRDLLTDQKVVYLRRNEEFLKQYQNMTCKCCSKEYATYKQFMAHMRKKYPSLSRNLCFKCLRQFQSKAMFVAHLKKKTCINLYKVYMNDDTVPKTGPLFMSPDKMGTKELLTNKVYECKLCQKTFRLKMEFRNHVNEDHAEEYQKRDNTTGVCGFCNMPMADSLTRKRHYNNMECIVVLHCGTCKEKFENHQQFIDHVYSIHLKSTAVVNDTSQTENNTSIENDATDAGDSNSHSLKYPQCCKICGQKYNNYYNVLRHMEAKHPDRLPKTYNCDECDTGFPRQSSLRDHMYDIHGKTLPKTPKREIFSCRMCSESFEHPSKWITHQSERHSRYTCCQCNYQNKNLEEFKAHIEIHPIIASNFLLPLPSESGSQNDEMNITNGGGEGDDEHDDEPDEPIPKKMKLENNTKKCKICHNVFNSSLGLSNHMRSHVNNPLQNKHLLNPKTLTLKIKTQSNTASKSEDPRKFGDARFRRMRCRVCQKRFSTKKGYRKHMLIDHQIRNVNFIKCGVCKAEFTHEKGLKVHMFKIHGTVLTSDSMEIQFECEVCGTVYRNEDQLNAHKNSVHGIPLDDDDVAVPPALPAPAAAAPNEPLLWFQCRYCPANFDTNKKLAIHINSHDEFDSNDYSCKDCGNVYSGRKSLWVHRYKKHPMVPEPSECKICVKMFFDKKMLFLHLKTHSPADVYEQLQKLRENLKQEETSDGHNYTATTMEEEEDEMVDEDNGNNEADEEELIEHVSCSVCGEKFNDQDLFDKHMQMHEMELYNDNPLAAMFDTGPEDPNQFFMNRMDENGEFICDICPKTFPMLSALKVHRNWHFRTDGKQIPADPNTVWRAISRKRNRSSTPMKCHFCNSTFTNTSNLRRHIIEIHKSEIGKTDNENLSIYIEKYLECQKCSLTFQTYTEWIEHKINDAKTSRSEGTYEWGCEICGKIVSRKERLVQHMHAHLKDDETNGSIISGDQGNSEMGFESNSQDSVSSNVETQPMIIPSGSGNEDHIIKFKQEEIDNIENNIVEKELSIVNNDNRNDNNNQNDNNEFDNSQNEDDSPGENSEDEQEEVEDDIRNVIGHVEHEASNSREMNFEEETNQNYENEENNVQNKENSGSYSCDLCQVYFDTSKKLRRHVTSHFLNGPGSVTLTEIPKDRTKMKLQSDVTTI